MTGDEKTICIGWSLAMWQSRKFTRQYALSDHQSCHTAGRMPYNRPGWIIIRATEQEGYQIIILDGSLAVQQSRGGVGGWGVCVWGGGGVCVGGVGVCGVCVCVGGGGGGGDRVGEWGIGWRGGGRYTINLDGTLAVQQSRGDAIPSAYN